MFKLFFPKRTPITETLTDYPVGIDTRPIVVYGDKMFNKKSGASMSSRAIKCRNSYIRNLKNNRNAYHI